ncbi:MAG: Asp-tRNA(Asn)/Glu-tRNA(Gln) amidotransferase subunit GatB, partial [Patescibacteria group bacterium]
MEKYKKYYPVIGLEIHAELKTNTKMFCSCKNDPDEENPNVNICPVCMAHPGALPVINKKAVENVIKVGLAVGGTIADFTEFDRKNYFYPDIPKGFQTSQYKYPIVSGGHLAGFDITRVHLEEDTANNKHFGEGAEGYSLIDFNRSGVPLMELVTEARVFDSAEDASKNTSAFAKEFQFVLWYLGVSEANMEKGEMRVEANISITDDPKKFGTKVEVKNLNSFKSVEKAIKYELDRMRELLEEGKGTEIVQETRGWDESKQKTFSQRKKEGSADYRYFPEPDLPKMKLHEAFDLEKMKGELPELPFQRRERFFNYGIKKEDIEVLIADDKLCLEFEATLSCFDELFDKKENSYNPKYAIAIANFVLSDLQAILKKEPNHSLPLATDFAILVRMFVDGKISSRVAKDLIPRLVYDRIDIKEVLEKENLIQNSDESSIKILVEKAITENPDVVAVYKSGKENAIMSLVGKIIKESNGS